MASLKTFALCWLTSSQIWLISSCVDDRHLLDKTVKKKFYKEKKPCLSVMHGELISEWIKLRNCWIFFWILYSEKFGRCWILHICNHFWRWHSRVCTAVWSCIQRENIRTSECWLHTSSFVVSSALLTHTHTHIIYSSVRDDKLQPEICSLSICFITQKFYSDQIVPCLLLPSFCFYARLTTKALTFLFFVFVVSFVQLPADLWV